MKQVPNAELTRLEKVRSLARIAIAKDLSQYPWIELDPVQARKLHARLPEPRHVPGMAISRYKH